MSAFDTLKTGRNRLLWAKVEPDKPGGLHRPKREGDVGWDLEAMEDVIIGPMGSIDVPVNARIHLPLNFYADIRNRSSMARRGLYVDQNVIDNGYRGPLFVFIRNMRLPTHREGYFDEKGTMRAGLARPDAVDQASIMIKAGERIAQLIFHHFQPVWDLEVAEIDTNTSRSENGFGSTGK